MSAYERYVGNSRVFVSVCKGTPNAHSKNFWYYSSVLTFLNIQGGVSGMPLLSLFIQACLITGLDSWTHLKWCEIAFPAFFSVGEKLIMPIQPTSLLIFAPLAGWGNLSRVSRGQRSRAYLISFNERLVEQLHVLWIETKLKSTENRRNTFTSSVTMKHIKYADLWPLLTPVKQPQQAKGANLTKKAE